MISRWWRLLRWVLALPRSLPQPAWWIEYSALHPDGSRTVYPSQVAYLFDPLWGRGDGSKTEARMVYRDGRTSRWRRTYAQDWQAIRRED